MKKLIIVTLFLSFVFMVLPLRAEVDPRPILDINLINKGLSVEVNGTASSSCGEIKVNWCRLEHPGKGSGMYEIKWGDGAITCSDLPSSHIFDQKTSYPFRIRIKNTCGYIGEFSKDIVIGSETATSTVPSVATTTETTATSTDVKTETKCAKEGEMTSGPVSPEYQFGCCAGLESMRVDNLLGSGNLCYDQTKGTPTCQSVGTKSEGWYYPAGQIGPMNIGSLVKWANCGVKEEPVLCTKEYIPVCGEKEVQCIKAPCLPIKQTYGNKCELGAAKARFLYEGACKIEIKPSVAVDKKIAERIQAQALKDFKKIFGRSANIKNTKDAWAIKIMSYGLNKVVRNINAENQAIKKFMKVFSRQPKNTGDWNIIKSIAYSGVKK